MFSTPMMASSTTTPNATASPPSVMVLMVQPSQSTTITAASSASGMETKATTTLRTSRRNRNNTTVMSSRARCSTSRRTPASAFSMKLAGRCSLGIERDPARRAGWAASSMIAASTARVTIERVGAVLAGESSITPGLPMMSASPNFGAPPSLTVAKSRSFGGVPAAAGAPTAADVPAAGGVRDSGRPRGSGHHCCPSAAASSVCPRLSMSTRWFGVSIKPPPRTPVAERTAATTSASARSRAFSSRGSTSHLELALVAPVEGRPGHPGNRQQPRPDRPLHHIAQLHRRQLVADEAELDQVHGRRDQRRRAWADLLPVAAARSPPQRLGDDLPRAVGVGALLKHHRDHREPGDGLRAHRLHAAAPLIACSIGSVTSSSTCSATSPGASVCTLACGGTNSGKTSYFARVSTSTPYTTSIAANAHTTTGKRRDQRMIAASIAQSAAAGGAGVSTPSSAAAPALTTRSPAANPLATNQPDLERPKARHFAAHEARGRGLHVHPHLRALAQQRAPRQYDTGCRRRPPAAAHSAADRPGASPEGRRARPVRRASAAADPPSAACRAPARATHSHPGFPAGR